MRERLLVIGNGMAGLRFVEEVLLRHAGHFAITVVGKEPEPAYNRVLLSSLLAGEVCEADIRLRDRGWYNQNAVDLLTGAAVTTLDPAARVARLADGREIGFDHAVLATGSQPIRPPIEGSGLSGVVTFRDLADIEVMRAAGPGSRAIVVGGGLLGIEAAYGLARAGLKVTLLHIRDRLMDRQLDGRAAELLAAAIEARGIEIALAADTSALCGTNRLEAVMLKDGRRFAADIVVFAIGIRPEAALARSAGLACNRGIVVDDGLATSAPGIYAIGECAEHRGQVYGLVGPAYAQARTLAERLTGRDLRFDGAVLATNLKVSGVHVFSAGEFLGGDDAEDIVFSDPGVQTYKKLVIRRDERQQRLVGAILVGDTTDGLWYLDLIRTGAPIGRMRSDLIFGRRFVDAA